jgi:hypothetical protein
MEYFVPIILAIIALIGWLKPQNANRRWTFLFIIVIVVLVVFQLIIQNDQNRSIAKLKGEGKLKSPTSIISTQTYATLEIGWEINSPGAFLRYRGGPLSTMFPGLKGSDWEQVLDEISLDIRERDNKILVSTVVRDSDGFLIAKLQDNEWKINPPPRSFDRNYNDNMLELKDSNGDIVFQIRVLKDKVQLNGVFYGSSGFGIAFMPPPAHKPEWVPIYYLEKNQQPSQKLNPIFKYPSGEHLGELR